MGGIEKVCVIGLDAATFSLINPWVEEGKLVHFKRLMEEGCFGNLPSTIPPQTPPAWTSSVTGQNPGKHNVYDFFKFDGDDYRRKLTNHGDRRTKAVWNLLSEEGKRVGIVNVPFTYPPEKVNGFMVSGSPIPSTARDHTYPDSLIREIVDQIPGYRLWSDLDRRDEETLLKEIYRTTETEIALVSYLMERKPWDFFMAVFVGLDIVQHLFWRHMDRSHPHHSAKMSNHLAEGILTCYQMMDRFLGYLVETLGEEVALLIYSDHGSGPLHKDFYITNWLIEEGFLVLKKRPKGLKSALALSSPVRRMGSLLNRLEAHGLGNLVPPKILKKLMRFIFPGYQKMVPLIDWAKTKAYFPTIGGQGLHINVQGREMAGIVQQGPPYEEVRRDLIEKLDFWIRSGVIEGIHRREEIYHGEYVANAPDLIMEARDGYRIQEGIGPGLLSPSREGLKIVSGSHRKEGVFLIQGRGIKKGREMGSMNIMDIAPTLLYLYGIPIPKAMDGKVLLEIFEDEYLQRQKVHFNERDMRREGHVFDYESDEKAEIMKKLETLGYIG